MLGTLAGAVALTGCMAAQANMVEGNDSDKVGIDPGGVRQTLEIKPKPGNELATFGAGCFWGVETAFREIPGVVATAVGYTGGKTQRPTYQQVCNGGTGHVEAVLVEFDPKKVSYERLLKTFWEWHNPTTPNRAGPDVGEQYRSAVWFHSAEQKAIAEKSKLAEAKNWDRPLITTITPAVQFWIAEEYHQQYDAKTGHKCIPPRLYKGGW